MSYKLNYEEGIRPVYGFQWRRFGAHTTIKIKIILKKMV